MRKLIFIFAIIILILATNSFAQNNKRQQKVRKPKSVVQYNTSDWDMLRHKKKPASTRKKGFYTLPEKDDEVLVAFRKKQIAKTSTRRKSNKYANQEVSYRKKSKFRKVKGVTHDPEFENWANRKRKITKSRRNK